MKVVSERESQSHWLISGASVTPPSRSPRPLRNPIAGVWAHCMLMGRIRRSSHIMGFDKVKINTTSLLLLPLEQGDRGRGMRRATHKHAGTHRHTSRQIPRQPSFSFSPRHLCCTLPLHPPHPPSHPPTSAASPRRGVCVLGINILPSSLRSFFSSRATPFASMDFHDNSFRKGPVFSPSSFSFTLPR